MMKTNTTPKIVSEIFFLLALLILTSTNAVVVVEDQQRSDNNNIDNSKNPLVRFFSKQYENAVQWNTKSSSSVTGGLLLRRQVRLLGDVHNNDGSSSSSSNTSNSNKIKERFGPGADWTCTSKGAINFDSCVVQQEEKGDDATSSSSDAAAAAADSSSCAWCPLGSTTGICLRTDQAELVNGSLENEDHLLHLQCYNNNIEQEQLHTDIATSTSFWDETMACHAHTSHSCAGHHNGEDISGKNHHICTWCTVKEPEIGMCISQNLWDNLVVAQALEEFDKDVSTNDQIRIDEVIHCVGGTDIDIDIGTDSSNNNDEKKSLFDTSTSTCGSKLLSQSASSLAKCLSAKGGVGGDGGGSEYCVIQSNPFPGLMGYVAGEYCMSQQQQRFLLWIIDLLRGLGWEKEMSSYAK